MMHKILMSIGILLMVGSRCLAQIIVATETENGAYSDGKYKTSAPEYISHFVLYPKENKLVRTELIRIATGDIIADDTEYRILATETIGDNSPGYPRQQVITAVGRSGTEAVEVLQIGDNFFNYCKTSFGSMFMAHGTIKKSIPNSQNIQNMLKDGAKKN